MYYINVLVLHMLKYKYSLHVTKLRSKYYKSVHDNLIINLKVHVSFVCGGACPQTL